MSKLESIIATGNRGWQAGPGQLMPNSHIECVDGYRISVIAGGGVYCSPRPALAFQGADGQSLTGLPLSPMFGETRHDYPGPFHAVEVAVLEGHPAPEPAAEWRDYASDPDAAIDDLRVYGYVPVEMVRALVAAHGGEAS